MRSTIMVMVIGLALVDAAGAVRLDSGSDAQVLLFPRYSTERDNETELTVRNLSASGKALRLIVRDAVDGRPTLTLNIYLTAGDVWSGRLVGQPERSATLLSNDESCTFPALGDTVGSGLANSDAFLAPAMQPGRLPRSRLSSGYVEVYELGEMDPAIAADCGAIAMRWSSGVWSGDRAADHNEDITAPGGQLTGTAFIKNTRTGASFVLDPTGLAAFRDAPVHTHPANITRPGLADASPAAATVATQTITLARRQIEVRDTLDFTRDPVAAVEAVLLTTALSGEIYSDADAGANAALLVLLPTRPYRRDGPFYGIATPAGLFATDPRVIGSVTETDGDPRDLTQPPGAVDCNALSAAANAVGLPNFFNFDHVCALGESELFIPNNSVRSFLSLDFDGRLTADDGTVLRGLPAIGHVLQTSRGSTAVGRNGDFARSMARQ